MKYFVAGTRARTAADLASVHRNSAIRFYHKLRCAICGEIEVDESYFGGICKGKRGGKVYTVPVSNVRRDTLTLIIQRKVKPDSGV
ncbi:MAG: hypothetical protein KDI13_00840 [Alphaproteobacteria bacterium]|nr:hypothetical protein [Alphaproteobacteria bacterium]